MTQPLVAPQNPELAIMHQYGIADRIKRVRPLLLDRGYLLKQPHVLQRQSQQVGNIRQIGNLIRLKL
jgi:hypothetical protein